jgi:hypothetical protein
LSLYERVCIGTGDCENGCIRDSHLLGRFEAAKEGAMAGKLADLANTPVNGLIRANIVCVVDEALDFALKLLPCKLLGF